MKILKRIFFSNDKHIFVNKNNIKSMFKSNNNKNEIINNVNNISEYSLLPESTLNLLKNLEKKNMVHKIENTFERFNSSNKSALRTIVDESLAPEDIFDNLVRLANAKLPNKTEKDNKKISLFLPIDDVLLFSYIPDENFGMADLPKHREYDFRIELPENKTFAFIFLRDNYKEFIEYIHENFEPIIFSTGEKFYIDKILSIIDPEEKFKLRLYQQDCHLFKDDSQNYLEYLKDINMITNRPINKKLLLDPSPFNYLLSPDNGN
jgi:TFIIF-interacting CTD phosphatase-like protein